MNSEFDSAGRVVRINSRFEARDVVGQHRRRYPTAGPLHASAINGNWASTSVMCTSLGAYG